MPQMDGQAELAWVAGETPTRIPVLTAIRTRRYGQGVFANATLKRHKLVYGALAVLRRIKIGIHSLGQLSLPSLRGG